MLMQNLDLAKPIEDVIFEAGQRYLIISSEHNLPTVMLAKRYPYDHVANPGKERMYLVLHEDDSPDDFERDMSVEEWQKESKGTYTAYKLADLQRVFGPATRHHVIGIPTAFVCRFEVHRDGIPGAMHSAEDWLRLISEPFERQSHYHTVVSTVFQTEKFVNDAELTATFAKWAADRMPETNDVNFK